VERGAPRFVLSGKGRTARLVWTPLLRRGKAMGIIPGLLTTTGLFGYPPAVESCLAVLSPLRYVQMYPGFEAGDPARGDRPCGSWGGSRTSSRLSPVERISAAPMRHSTASRAGKRFKDLRVCCRRARCRCRTWGDRRVPRGRHEEKRGGCSITCAMVLARLTGKEFMAICAPRCVCRSRARVHEIDVHCHERSRGSR